MKIDAYAQSWLALQCKMIAGASRGLVALGAPDQGPYQPAAHWPEGRRSTPGLSATAQRAISERKGVMQEIENAKPSKGAPLSRVACPLLVNGRIFGVVAIEMSDRPEPQQRAVLQLLQWSSAWLEVLFNQQAFAGRDQLVSVLQITAACLEQSRFQAATTALANDLATRLSCDRVSIGLVRGGHVRLHALSHSARFGRKTNLVRAIEAAMEEALDQNDTVLVPAAEDAVPQITRAHETLLRQHGARTVCTVPLAENGHPVGAVTLERSSDRVFAPDTITLCRHMATLTGPILELKRREDRWLAAKAWDSLHGQIARLLGAGHLKLKVAIAGSAALVAFLAVADGAYRVTAPATLEGTVQRVVVAPMDGFVAAASVRAGDIVREGQTLSRLKDKDLKLERLKWVSQREQLLREHRSALVTDDRAQVSILNAQIDQAEAEVALLDEQLSRTHMVAPIDGIVVSGDLSQSIGAPVQRGDVLFEVAPLDSYRLILEVDERDIADLAVDQEGKLALSGMPGEILPITVEKITPVAVSREGRNFFRVEARVEGRAERLRPGMEGVGKIHIDSRKLLWIWTHRLTDWLRLWAWSWWP